MKYAFFLFVLACGGQTIGDDGGTDAGIADAAGDSIISPSDVCDGDPSLTGNHLLSLLHPLYMATFFPTTGQPSELQLFVSPGDGPIVCHPHQVSNGGPPDMPASISAPITIQFFTADGLFQEKLGGNAVLTSNAPTTSIPFIATMPTSQLQGKYQPVIGGTWAEHDVSFAGELVFPPTFDAGQDNGSTSGNVSEQASNGNMGQVTSAGSWK